MELDFTDKYNTQLSPTQEKEFMSWSANQSSAAKRNILNDNYDYDMRGLWLKNKGEDLSPGHLTDQFKKPNHPTFSDQSQYNGTDGYAGGTWEKQKNGSYNFNPGPGTIQMFGPEKLQDYFKSVEPGNSLILPPSARPPFEGAKKAPDGNWYFEYSDGQHAAVLPGVQ